MATIQYKGSEWLGTRKPKKMVLLAGIWPNNWISFTDLHSDQPARPRDAHGIPCVLSGGHGRPLCCWPAEMWLVRASQNLGSEGEKPAVGSLSWSMMMINMFGIINISGIVFATITIIIVISCYFYVQKQWNKTMQPLLLGPHLSFILRPTFEAMEATNQEANPDRSVYRYLKRKTVRRSISDYKCVKCGKCAKQHP